MMGLQRVFVLLALGLTTTLGTIVPTSAKELGTPVHLKYSNPFRVPVSMEDRLWRNLQLQHVIQYNEAEQCRRSKDPFEIPAMILRDPNIGEAGAPPQNPTDQIIKFVYETIKIIATLDIRKLTTSSNCCPNLQK
jgi:hypothetical protein